MNVHHLEWGYYFTYWGARAIIYALSNVPIYMKNEYITNYSAVVWHWQIIFSLYFKKNSTSNNPAKIVWQRRQARMWKRFGDFKYRNTIESTWTSMAKITTIWYRFSNPSKYQNCLNKLFVFSFRMHHLYYHIMLLQSKHHL